MGGVEAEGAESEGENQREPSRRGRCIGGGVRGVEAREWRGRWRIKGGLVEGV